MRLYTYNIKNIYYEIRYKFHIRNKYENHILILYNKILFYFLFLFLHIYCYSYIFRHAHHFHIKEILYIYFYPYIKDF